MIIQRAKVSPLFFMLHPLRNYQVPYVFQYFQCLYDLFTVSMQQVTGGVIEAE